MRWDFQFRLVIEGEQVKSGNRVVSPAKKT
jgi:hypothetical protein